MAGIAMSHPPMGHKVKDNAKYFLQYDYYRGNRGRHCILRQR